MNDDLPPSARYVYYVLEQEGSKTRQQLLEELNLPERTLDRALETLQSGDLIAKTRDNTDSRQVVAKVAGEA